MTAHVNFYENIEEALIRLNKTVVMYDGKPKFIRAITNHKDDGVFRVYLENLSDISTKDSGRQTFYYGVENFNAGNNALGAFIDKYLETNKDCGILRKKMNSPLFNRFKPFPLGMTNLGDQGGGKCVFLERMPQRNREQGLTASMIVESLVSLSEKDFNPRGEGSGGLNHCNMYSGAFEDMLNGVYPKAEECLDALLDPDVTNQALAFHRLFALIRGPIGLMFLAYKDDVIGVLRNGDFTEVTLGAKFRHIKEVVQDLGLFKTVAIK